MPLTENRSARFHCVPSIMKSKGKHNSLNPQGWKIGHKGLFFYMNGYEKTWWDLRWVLVLNWRPSQQNELITESTWWLSVVLLQGPETPHLPIGRLQCISTLSHSCPPRQVRLLSQAFAARFQRVEYRQPPSTKKTRLKSGLTQRTLISGADSDPAVHSSRRRSRACPNCSE